VAQIVVFQQNRNYLGLSPLAEFSWRTGARLLCERMLSRMLRRRVNRYLVQTPAMSMELLRWYGTGGGATEVPEIILCPFVDDLPVREGLRPAKVRWQFVYVADGEAHKNHKRLVEAWGLLAREGIRPSLALTLSSRDAVLRAEIKSACLTHDLKIVDLGPMAREEIFDLYGCSDALIFPSTSESFGLPLVEAAHFGIPILAGELDYVRDVCVPEQTFNPHSSVSIAKAVKRHLGIKEEKPRCTSATDFWLRLLGDS
jgi:glycosyltransferase involved in cell wall biosynthesis